MTRVIARTLSEISELLDGAATRRDHEIAFRESIESETSDGQFEVLYALVRNATALHHELTEQGATPPLDAVPYIRRFFQLTESMAVQGT